MMREDTVNIDLAASGRVTALWTRPDGSEGKLLFAYAPGSGSNLQDPFGAFLAAELARQNIQCLRFQFPYMEAGRKAPDRNPVLESTWFAAITAAQKLSENVVVGGRSMGGRIASQVVGQAGQIDGLALFAYPLHPPGRPGRLRNEHLSSIAVPTLFCSGTRDAFGSPDELQTAGSLVSSSTVHFITGADHGFNILKSSGRTRADVWAEAFAALMSFLRA